MKSVTVFQRSKDSQGRCIMAFAKLPDGRGLSAMRRGAGGLLAGEWRGEEVMIGMNAAGVTTTMYLNAEQVMALATELLALAADIPGAMHGGVQ